MAPRSLKPSTIAPKWGVNYNVGHIGFTSPIKDPDFVSIGITYFERWDKLGDIDVVHAFIVTDKNECVEAIINKGVVRDPLQDYFNDPKTHVFFRKPLGYQPEIGARIAATAGPEVGKQYDDMLIAAFALRGSFFGRFITSLFGPAPTTSLNDFMHHNGRWICSELAGHCLDSQPEYLGKGTLATPDFAIDPQMLFEDQSDATGNHVFEDWHRGPIPASLVSGDSASQKSSAKQGRTRNRSQRRAAGS